MNELIDFMPGIDLPVGEVSEKLSKMWEENRDNPLSGFRASQMNLVLHFGRNVKSEDAKSRFNIALKFAQKYPSRIIVLCPFLKKIEAMRAKLFSQCYIGKSHREMCCCEALFLGYSSEDNGFLHNQVSVWLESDLPIYHWFSEVRKDRVMKYFPNLLKRVNKIVYDSNVESDAFIGIKWPFSNKVVDLARARLLPVKQAIGQYLSSYSVDLLTNELESIKIYHSNLNRGDANHLGEWLQSTLKSEKISSLNLTNIELNFDSEKEIGFKVIYKDGRFIEWYKNRNKSLSNLRHTIEGINVELAIKTKPMAPEQELSEAFYFASI